MASTPPRLLPRKSPIDVMDRVPDQKARLGITPIAERVLQALTIGDRALLIELTRSLADGLAGPDGDGCRARTVSRALALANTQSQVFEALLGEALVRRDFAAVDAINRVLECHARRMRALLDEHRIETGKSAPTSIVASSMSIRVGS